MEGHLNTTISDVSTSTGSPVGLVVRPGAAAPRREGAGAAAGSGLLAPVDVTTGATNSVDLSAPSRIWDADRIIVGSAAIDWLTLTTFSLVAYTWLVRQVGLFTPAHERASARVMQYRGCQGEGYFFGSGDQNGRDHFMVRLSGSLAHQLVSEALHTPLGAAHLSAFKCTRVDVQYTHDQPLGINPADTCRTLRLAEWTRHKGRRPYLECIDGDNGLNTCYIGQRKESNRFQRIYIKVVGDEQLLRWEAEYKEELARILWEKLLSVGVVILSAVLAGELDIVPLPEEYEPMKRGIGATPERLKLRQPTPDELRTLNWLHKSVRPAALRLLGSSDPAVRQAVKDFFMGAYFADEIPEYEGPERSVDEWLPPPDIM